MRACKRRSTLCSSPRAAFLRTGGASRRRLLGVAALAFAAHLALAQAGSGGLFLSLLSGTYREDQTLVMEALEPGTRVTYAIADSSGGRFTSVSYREPLRLTAIRGEERSYRLSVTLWRGAREVESRVLDILIDRLAPAVPAVDPAGGAHEGRVQVSFRAPPGAAVYYAVNRDVLTQASRWDGRPFVVEPERGDQVLQYYAMDEAGNRSDIATDLYTRRAKERELSPRLEIVSPAEGTFANQQYLYLISEDVGTIRYTLDGTDPARFGSLYTEPRLLEFSGRLRLRVAAFPAGSDRNPLMYDRTFEVVPEKEQSLVVGTPSGVYPDERTVEVLGSKGVIFYTASDARPDDHSLVYATPLRLPSTAGARRVSVLRMRLLKTDASWGGEYRYFYVSDRRTPPEPVIEVVGRQPARSAVSVRIERDASATVRYTLDGTEPGLSSTLYSAPFGIEPAAAGHVVVKAVASDARGVRSAVISQAIAFDTTPPARPAVEVSELLARRAVRITVQAENGATLVHELARGSAKAARPTAASAVSDASVLLDVPVGSRGEFSLRFAAIDAAGNLSEPTEEISVVIDKEPPALPAAIAALDGARLDTPLELPVAGLPELHYELRDDGSMAPDPTLASPTASEGEGKGLTFAGKAGELARYSFSVLLRDELGNSSDPHGPFSLSVDRRKPVLPPIAGVADGERVSSPGVAIRSEDPEGSGVRVAYALSTDGSTPEAPTPLSPLLSGSLEIKAVEGQEVPYTVVFLPLSASGNLVGDPVALRFVLDRKPPSLPVASGLTDGMRSGKPVVLGLTPAAEDDELYYSVSEREVGADPVAPGDPLTTGRRYTAPVVLDAEPGREVTLTVRVCSRDRAGNRSSKDITLTATVDKRPPDAVALSGLPASGVTRGAVTVSMSSTDPQVLYEVSDDGTEPPPPDADSPSYVSPLVLSGKDGEEVEYRIRCRAVDDVGNVGPATTVHVFTIDRKAPPPPPVPSVTAVPSDPSRFIVSWPDPSAALVFHRLARSGTGAEFRRYASPFDVSGVEGTGAVELECYAEDPAGNRSQTARYSLSAVRRLAVPAVLGGENGAVYRGDRILVFDAPGGVVRYEMTLDGTMPPPVTQSSRIATGPVELSVPEGATMDVAIRLRAFPDRDLSVASADGLFGMRIDRTPPEAPVADGIVDGGFYRDQVTVRLLAPEGTIYYGIEAEGKGAAIPEPVDANRYQQPIVLRVGEGEIASYRIVAYTVDEAQNRSWNVRSWNVTLDNKVIHVSENGDDTGPGTRDKPLRTLHEAVRSSALTPRKEIHVALGTYALDETLVLAEGVTLVGGYSDTWEPAGLGRKTTVTAGEEFPGGAPLLRVSGGIARLLGFRFTSPANVAPTLVAVEGAEARLEECALYLTRGEDRVGVDVTGGKLTIVSSELESDDGASGALVRGRGAALTLSATSLKGPRVSAAFAAVVIQQGSSASLTAVRIDPGGGQRTDGIWIEKSDLALVRSTVESGAAGTQGTALRCVGARVEVTDSTLAGSPGGLYTFALYADASSVAVRGSRMTLAARAGATGAKARGGEIVVERSEIRAADTREFAYLADLGGTRARFFTNVMIGGKSGDAVVAVLSGGQCDWYNNTIVAGTGAGLTTGFYITDAGSHRILNNILVRREADAGTAIVRLGDTFKDLTVIANDFAGWSTLLSADAGSGRAGRLAGGTAIRIAGIDELNGSDGAKSGGPIALNVREPLLRTFRVSKQEDYHLAPTSLCVNRGVAVDADPYEGPLLDMDGERRPAPLAGGTPAYDIGADELY